MGWLWWERGVGEFDGEDGMIHEAIRAKRWEGRSDGRRVKEEGAGKTWSHR